MIINISYKVFIKTHFYITKYILMCISHSNCNIITFLCFMKYLELVTEDKYAKSQEQEKCKYLAGSFELKLIQMVSNCSIAKHTSLILI